jgi:hypothetical protein
MEFLLDAWEWILFGELQGVGFVAFIVVLYFILVRKRIFK